LDSVVFGGWQFSFDKKVTEQYYRDLNDLCSCAMCKNFYMNVNEMPADLRGFLESFGINPAKPIEQWSCIADKETMCVDNTLCYAIHGTATSDEGYEIDFPKGVSVVVQLPGHGPNITMPIPCFIFKIFGLWFPWTVEEDINNCYSERKPSLLRRLFSRKRK